MTDVDKLRLAVDEHTFVGDVGTLGVILVAEIDRLRAELAAAAEERQEERALLVFLARAYVALQDRFGTPGQSTFMEFPSIQGSPVRHVVEALAAVEWPMTCRDPRAVLGRVEAAGLKEEQAAGGAGVTS